MPIDPEYFRTVMRHVAVPVTVVTVRHGDELHGMTVSSFSSVSLDPPLVVVSLQVQSHTCQLVKAAGHFAVNVLGAGQEDVARFFARPRGDKGHPFATLTHRAEVTGSPILQDCMCWYDCTVQSSQPVGTGVIFIGSVEAAGLGSHSVPLLYRNRTYFRLTLDGTLPQEPAPPAPVQTVAPKRTTP